MKSRGRNTPKNLKLNDRLKSGFFHLKFDAQVTLTKRDGIRQNDKKEKNNNLAH